MVAAVVVVCVESLEVLGSSKRVITLCSKQVVGNEKSDCVTDDGSSKPTSCEADNFGK